MRKVTKNIFLNSLNCDYLGWTMRQSAPSKTLEIYEKFLIEQGREIGKRAQGNYPNGILINERDFESATEKTQTLIADKKEAIFEAAFLSDNYSTKADILSRMSNGWHLIEVKSGLSEKPEYIDDMAYTAMVIGRTGIPISKISLLLLSKDYRLGMDNKDLFIEIDCTEKVRQQVTLFETLYEEIEARTREEPTQELKLFCKKCSIFNECTGNGISNHILELPYLRQGKFEKLLNNGIVSINDIPDGFDLTENQARIRNCVKSGKPLAGKNLKKELDNINWPAYYLDFETVLTALPLYPDIAPHTQIPTQYSIHKCSKPGDVIEHFEYLADPSKDCRKELAQKLIKVLEGDSSIIVYSNFEKTRIKDLMSLFPELSEELNQLLNRLVDLELIIKNNYNHPEFHGRTSIKQTLPVLVPDMSYEGMEISDGFTASAYFAYLALGKFQDVKAVEVKSNLLKYCKLDTLGMVKLHECLMEFI